MSVEPGSAVMIGDALATSEELLPGPGTYDDGADIRAARVGTFEIDSEEFAATVRPATSTPVVLQPGDFVIGEVYIVKESMTGIRVVCRADAPGVNISGEVEGTLHVAKMADRYVASMEDEFKKGDVVRAEVIQAKPSVQLTTKGPGLGVIQAHSVRTREQLKRVPKMLIPMSMDADDPEAQRVAEYRYIAEDYGRGTMLPDEENFVRRDIPVPQSRGRDDRGFGGRGGGRGGPPRGRGGDRDRGGRGGDRGGGRGGPPRGRGGDRDRGGRSGDREGGGRSGPPRGRGPDRDSGSRGGGPPRGRGGDGGDRAGSSGGGGPRGRGRPRRDD